MTAAWDAASFTLDRGSGRKLKKCHGQIEPPPAPRSRSDRLRALEPQLDREQICQLSRAELAELDLTRLLGGALVELVQRQARLRDWHRASLAHAEYVRRVATGWAADQLLGQVIFQALLAQFELGHYELTSWSPIACPKAAIVYAGLLFSALTVLGWSSDMFGSRAKAIGFTALLEGIMMTANAGWLSGIALCYLVAINAVANGCRLALHDSTVTVDWPTNLARAIMVAASAGAATRVRTPARRHDRGVRAHARQRRGSRRSRGTVRTESNETRCQVLGG